MLVGVTRHCKIPPIQLVWHFTFCVFEPVSKSVRVVVGGGVPTYRTGIIYFQGLGLLPLIRMGVANVNHRILVESSPIKSGKLLVFGNAYREFAFRSCGNVSPVCTEAFPVWHREQRVQHQPKFFGYRPVAFCHCC